MTTSVSDARSNSPDQIAYVAKVLGRSEPRIAVFRAIHSGRGRRKTAARVAKVAGMRRKRVLEEAIKLVHKQVITQTKRADDVVYERDDFCYANREEIIRLARNPKKLKAYPTKYSPKGPTINLSFKVAKNSVQTKVVTLDDIESFSKARKVKNAADSLTMKENTFKTGVQKLLGQKGTFKDWGGETSDLYTTRLKMAGGRQPAAFAFKGKGLTGLLTPARMGKNGDQIQRLFIEDADVFLLQYGGQIASSVIQQMAIYAQAKSLSTGRLIRYGTLDGGDSARLVAAYPKAFGMKKSRSRPCLFPSLTPPAPTCSAQLARRLRTALVVKSTHIPQVRLALGTTADARNW